MNKNVDPTDNLDVALIGGPKLPLGLWASILAHKPKGMTEEEIKKEQNKIIDLLAFSAALMDPSKGAAVTHKETAALLGQGASRKSCEMCAMQKHINAKYNLGVV